MLIETQACKEGMMRPLSVQKLARGHLFLGKGQGPCAPADMPAMPVGTSLCGSGGEEIFKVTGHGFLPNPIGPHALFCPFLKAMRDLDEGVLELSAKKDGFSVAWITLSDSGFAGGREDTSGPAIAERLSGTFKVAHMQGYLLPDNEVMLRGLLTRLALEEGCDLVVTTGGTGVAPTDVSPQATARVLDYELPGFAQAMMMASLQKTSRAVISRAKAGVIDKTLVLNLPGSRKAVLENLEAVLPALAHTMEKLHGDPAPCGEPAK